MIKQKAIFLDRDGVLNRERGDYTYREKDFEILEGVIDSLKVLKAEGYLLIIITNQGGISKGIYSIKEVNHLHNILQKSSGNIIDEWYFAPFHCNQSKSLSRKPNPIMWERAIARFNIDVNQSWMLGDSERDITPANSLGIKTIRISNTTKTTTEALFISTSLWNSLKIIQKK